MLVDILSPIFLLSGLALAADETPETAFSRLAKEHDRRVTMWVDATGSGGDDATNIARYESYPLWETAPQMVELATRATAPEEAFAALGWVIEQARSVGVSDRRFAQVDHQALDLLLRDHRQHAEFGPLCLSVALYYSPNRERFLRAVLNQSSDVDTRAFATFGLSEALTARRDGYFYRRVMPANEQPFAAYLERNFDPGYLAALQNADPEKLFVEIEGLLERIRREFAEHPYRYLSSGQAPGAYRDQKLGELAERALFELRHLSPDRAVPDAVGEDLDGRPFSLAQHRGRVVVLAFWHIACGPCLAAMDDERKLLERFRDRPLTVLGVNTDEDRDVAKRKAVEHGATWPSLWDRDKQLANRWNVNSWPTTYVLDHRGKVVVKADPRDGQFATLIERLVKEAEAATR
jgi:peroxiredoxin